jgi:cellulose synthase/poly-beta-1,6-N-acetylglucosamine synthase-like glycosyltransferase
MDREALNRKLLVALLLLVSLGGVAFGLYLLSEVFVSPIDRLMGAVLVLLMGVNALFNLSGSYYFLRSFTVPRPRVVPLQRFPTVAVVVPFRYESPAIVKKTLEALFKLDYPRAKITFYALDSSNRLDEEFVRWCRARGVRHAYVQNPTRLKAWALNRFLPQLREQYVAFFDADDVLFDPSFLKENLGHLEADASLAAVQAQKEYAPSTPFGNLVNAYYTYFFKFIQPVRSAHKSAMFCGSAGILRTAVLQKVGFPMSPTEDTAFSFAADLAGHGTLFVPKVYAHGAPITKFSDFLAQQWRYTAGNTRLVYDYLRNFLSMGSWRKRFHYATQVFSFAYLSYLFILYAVLTVAFVMLGLATPFLERSIVVADWVQWVSVSYTLAVVAVTLAGAKLYFGSYRLGIGVLFVNFSLSLMRAKAVLYALLGLPKGLVWHRHRYGSMTWRDALHLTRAETYFALVLFTFAALALARADLVSGFWLAWYGVFFSSSLAFALTTEAGVRL